VSVPFCHPTLISCEMNSEEKALAAHHSGH
jgi:hypothetical protein